MEIRCEAVGSFDRNGWVSLDSLAGNIHGPCLVKLDVDVGEEAVLIGARRFNRLPGIRWLIETHSKALEAACLRILVADGFQKQVIRNARWRAILPETRPIEHNRWLAAWKEQA